MLEVPGAEAVCMSNQFGNNEFRNHLFIIIPDIYPRFHPFHDCIPEENYDILFYTENHVNS